ncbi:MAG: hypothetical protein L3J93_05870 [Thermoplasmata archaeon]|nr:hypothetical protein [Thermoplasmata archaeon]
MPPSSSVHASASGSGHATHHPHVEVGHLPSPWRPTAATPSLPIGAAILAFLIGIGGLVLILAGGLFLVNYYTMGAVPNALLIVHAVTALGAALLVLLGAVVLALATALWRQEAWALYTMVVILFGSLAFLFFTASITYLFLVLIGLFVYLLAVRRHFF